MLFNPASLVRTKPPEAKSTRAIPTREQVDQAFVIARSLAPDLDVFVATAALTGFRRQALCGLRWSDVDFETQSIFIRRVINVVGGRVVLVDYRSTVGASPRRRPSIWIRRSFHDCTSCETVRFRELPRLAQRRLTMAGCSRVTAWDLNLGTRSSSDGESPS